MLNASINDFIVFTVSSSDEDYEKHLKKSLSGIPRLKSEFMLGKLDTNIAHEYNSFIARCKQRFVVFCHQDVEFSDDLIDVYLKFYDPAKIGAAGIIGKSADNAIVFGGIRPLCINYEITYKARTLSGAPEQVMCLDSCMVIVDKECKGFFDEVVFNGLHCFVEDFCCQQRNRGRAVIVLPLRMVDHFGTTTKKCGDGWGNYLFYYHLLHYKWDKIIGVNTT